MSCKSSIVSFTIQYFHIADMYNTFHAIFAFSALEHNCLSATLLHLYLYGLPVAFL